MSTDSAAEFTSSPLARRSHLVSGELTAPSEKTQRTPTEHDHDRVLYSAAFRRLGGVTQTSAGPVMSDVHNRLTHSLRVEHMGDAIARILSQDYNGIDTAAVRAACLAHDLGHPPFGHIGEEKLDQLVRCEKHRGTGASKPHHRISGFKDHRAAEAIPCQACKLPDGFEGNAQSFRIVTRLETNSSVPGIGLDLTRLSLSALSKYPWLNGDNIANPRKWGAYDCDVQVLDFCSPANTKDLHAEIMDWADDIAYSVHDIEDFYRQHRIPLQDYRMQVGTTVDGFWEYVDAKFTEQHRADILEKGRETVEGVFESFPQRSFQGSADDFAAIDGMRSGLITLFLNYMSIESDHLEIEDSVAAANTILKELTWYHVIDNPDLLLIQRGQQRLIERLWDQITDLVLPKIETLQERILAGSGAASGLRWVPPRLLRYLELGWRYNQYYDRDESALRAILDYLASLSDDEAYYVDGVLQGGVGNSRLGAATFIT